MAAHRPVNPPPTTVRSAVTGPNNAGAEVGASGRSDQKTAGRALLSAWFAQPEASTTVGSRFGGGSFDRREDSLVAGAAAQVA